MVYKFLKKEFMESKIFRMKGVTDALTRTCILKKILLSVYSSFKVPKGFSQEKLKFLKKLVLHAKYLVGRTYVLVVEAPSRTNKNSF